MHTIKLQFIVNIAFICTGELKNLCWCWYFGQAWEKCGTHVGVKMDRPLESHRDKLPSSVLTVEPRA